jgi:membrane-associated HD superfamily phosphohydrolase
MALKYFIILLFLIFTSGTGYSSTSPKNKLQSPQNTISDTLLKKDSAVSDNRQNSLPIDTIPHVKVQETLPLTDTARKIDSSLLVPVSENTMTNTKLFIYILLSILGLGLFFFIFVINLFKTFHKKKSTRQSLLLSWNLFFVVSIIWVFIIWGLLAGLWTSASFMVVLIFLFIISLIMTIIAVKSK